ncbi:hypothetical protein BH11PSE2_BH11PSE2_10910 [soil metagenome]
MMLIAAALALTMTAAEPQAPAPQAPVPAAAKPSLDCAKGPIAKSYGGTVWRVYGCADNTSLVVAADKDSPAFPFYFILIIDRGEIKLSGQGTGSKAATDKAYADLLKVDTAQYTALLKETAAAKP